MLKPVLRHVPTKHVPQNRLPEPPSHHDQDGSNTHPVPPGQAEYRVKQDIEDNLRHRRLVREILEGKSYLIGVRSGLRLAGERLMGAGAGAGREEEDLARYITLSHYSKVVYNFLLQFSSSSSCFSHQFKTSTTMFSFSMASFFVSSSCLRSS